jgi:hypothetical protein
MCYLIRDGLLNSKIFEKKLVFQKIGLKLNRSIENGWFVLNIFKRS